MAATIASAAAKGNILVLMGGGARLSGRPRFGTAVNSATFRVGPRFYDNNKMTLLKANRKPGTALFCTAQPEQAVAESDEAKLAAQPQPSIREAAGQLDIRVGRVVKAWRHEEADSLYVEEVDVGEAEPRLICSGLVAHVPLERLQGLGVVVLANLKPRNMRGVRSSGMLMAASDASHSNVELLLPPEGSLPGHRVWFGDPALDDEGQPLPLPPPATPNQVQKKKIWELVQPHLGTDGSGVAVLEGHHVMMSPAGPITAPSLKNANIS